MVDLYNTILSLDLVALTFTLLADHSISLIYVHKASVWLNTLSLYTGHSQLYTVSTYFRRIFKVPQYVASITYF
jgi:hypothetical protein